MPEIRDITDKKIDEPLELVDLGELKIVESGSCE